MTNEFNALIRKGTLSLVPSDPSLNLVGYKWVYRMKGKLCRVAKGFHQCPDHKAIYGLERAPRAWYNELVISTYFSLYTLNF